MDNVVPDFVFSLQHDKFIYRERGRWNLSNPISKQGILNFVMDRGLSKAEAKTQIDDGNFLTVFGADMFPRQDVMVTIEGHPYLNTWVPPTLVPQPGPYPRITRMLQWLTADDPAALMWLVNWAAAKVQNPAWCPKVAVVFTTEQGGGKGTFAFLMRAMLGPENCETIEASALENRFNAKWASNLFVLADEILTGDSYKDLSNSLKVLIDGDHIELEAKGQNQRSIKNRLAWVFASNATTTPLVLERSDRRYSIFSNHDPVPEEYAKLLKSCFKPDNSPADDFVPEMAGFFHELLNQSVDLYAATQPFRNEARQSLIDASLSGEELFFREVDENGIDKMLVQAKWKDFDLNTDPDEWDFGEKGVATMVIYACYRQFCDRAGSRPLKLGRFGRAIHAHRPRWDKVRNEAPSGRRPWCYRVKRAPIKGGGLPNNNELHYTRA